jgi:hypothetical protein
MLIDGIEYIRKDSLNNFQQAESTDGLPYVIARSHSAGVFAGYLKNRNGGEVTLLNARRLWYWKGAASLSQLSKEGVKYPNECKFPCEVDYVELIGVCEILPVTEKAAKSIASVKVWKE